MRIVLKIKIERRCKGIYRDGGEGFAANPPGNYFKRLGVVLQFFLQNPPTGI